VISFNLSATLCEIEETDAVKKMRSIVDLNADSRRNETWQLHYFNIHWFVVGMGCHNHAGEWWNEIVAQTEELAQVSPQIHGVLQWCDDEREDEVLGTMIRTRILARGRLSEVCEILFPED
jgi:hypothetical protein